MKMERVIVDNAAFVEIPMLQYCNKITVLQYEL